ncbi:MAG: ribosomal L7Ae/L30e/S12e/Gadd45 family protein [Nitrososphaerales archaeon]
MSERELGLILSKAVKTGKCVLGLKEVQKSVRGSKIVIYSTLAPKDKLKTLIEACRAANVPTLPYNKKPFELGLLCGKRFRVSALAIKSAGDADLTPLLAAQEREKM